MKSNAIRSQFPIFSKQDGHLPLAYLDSASTTQKPQVVLDAMSHFYASDYANVHRGMYPLAVNATEQYEVARQTVADFIGAGSAREVIWTSGTTNSINLVAQSFLKPRLRPGDAVAVTIAEHHSNFVPWQQLCTQTGAELRIIPIAADGQIDLDAAGKMLDGKVKLLAFTHLSNVTGLMSPVDGLVKLAHAHSIPVLLDAAQSAAHLPINVQDLDIDFLAFSGHKLYGPTGTGVLYAKESFLQQMEPVQFGGDMIRSVDIDHSTWNELPHRFEAGTPNFVGAIGLGAAVEFVQSIGFDTIQAQESMLMQTLHQRLRSLPSITPLGDATTDRYGVISFTFGTYHPHDVASILGEQNIAVRGGDHCSQPLHTLLDLKGSVRASLGVYSSQDDIDRLIHGLKYVQNVLGGAHG